MEEIKSLLRQEIKDEISDLGNIEQGTEEYETSVNGIARLTDKLVDLERLDQEQRKMEFEKTKFEKEKIEKEKDQILKRQEIESNNKNQLRNSIVNIGIFTVSAGITLWTVLMTWGYEESGTIGSTAGKKAISNALELTSKALGFKR